MRADFHRPVPGEADPELMLVGMSTGALVWGCGWMASGLPLPECAFHAVTGCPCPTCGATRCVIALLHGRVGEALGWNPMVFAGMAAVALLNIYAAAVLAGRLRRVRVSLEGAEARIVRVACVLLVLANWGYEIHRGV